MNLHQKAPLVTQHLTFFVGDEEYAVLILHVREVLQAIPITRVPSTPPAIRGVVNLRGSVVPVIDLGVRFGLSPRPITRWTSIVVIAVEVLGEPTIMGLLVDSVNQVIDLLPGAIESVPSFGTHVRVEFLRAIGVVGPRFVMILDLDRVLSPSDLLATAALEDASAAIDASSAESALVAAETPAS